ncbi:MAG: hypothetical protein JNM33_16365 [Rubrivivax sp.]|nr:hypothetical protein [Rubrivivax sp.]
MLQNLAVGLIVGTCSAYAAWALMPMALRQRLTARWGLKARGTSGCGGCSGCAPARPAAAQPIHILRRPPSA